MAEPLRPIKSKDDLEKVMKEYRVVAVLFYVTIASEMKAVYEQIALQFKHPLLQFCTVDTTEGRELVKHFEIKVLPAYLVMNSGKLSKMIQGLGVTTMSDFAASIAEELAIAQQISMQEEMLTPPEKDALPMLNVWHGADLPRGYSDITYQVESSGTELLNADEDFGPVKSLFSETQPSCLTGFPPKSPEPDWVQSGADDQLLLYMPLQSTVKLHTLQLTSLPPQNKDDAPGRPGTIYLFINRPQNMDFGEAEDAEPTQTIELTDKDWSFHDGTASISLRYVKFQKVSSLILFVQKGDGKAETIRLDRVRLIGEAGPKREMGQLKKFDDEDGE